MNNFRFAMDNTRTLIYVSCSIKYKNLHHQNESGGLPTFVLFSYLPCLDEIFYLIEGKTCQDMISTIIMPLKIGVLSRICGQTYWKWEEFALNFPRLEKKRA
jgi:hypothetical protein